MPGKKFLYNRKITFIQLCYVCMHTCFKELCSQKKIYIELIFDNNSCSKTLRVKILNT